MIASREKLTAFPCSVLQPHSVVLALPVKTCMARAAERPGHEGGLQVTGGCLGLGNVELPSPLLCSGQAGSCSYRPNAEPAALVGSWSSAVWHSSYMSIY